MRIDRTPAGRLSQGDVLKDVIITERVSEQSGFLDIAQITFPLVLVLTQDCDLEQDFEFRSVKEDANQDKWLLSVLVAPIYNAEHIYSGEHLSALSMTMMSIKRSGTLGQALRNNQTPRFHYLNFPNDSGLPPGVVDFKHYFSVNGEQLRTHKTNHFACRISELFREDVSHRFASYLSRIGLPT